MTELRQRMLEELQRRNYSKETIRTLGVSDLHKARRGFTAVVEDRVCRYHPSAVGRALPRIARQRLGVSTGDIQNKFSVGTMTSNRSFSPMVRGDLLRRVRQRPRDYAPR